MTHRARPVLLLAAALTLAAALLLTACSGVRPAPAAMPAVYTAPQALLSYRVEAGVQTYPFVVSVFQNDADGIGFRYDLGDGAQTGSVSMTAEAVRGATAMLNRFGSSGYELDDRTSVWLARGPFASLKGGGAVALDLGDGPVRFSGGCGETYDVGTAGGGSFAVAACRFAGDGQTLVVADDAEQPLILSMDTGAFGVTLEAAAPR